MGIAGRNAAILAAILLAAPSSGSAALLDIARSALSESRRAQEPSLDEVLSRAASYVTRFHEQLSGIVAEERYEQEVKHLAGGRGTLPRQRLMSDLLLVRPPGADRYIEFRDVFEVNGRPVRDRDERLVKLFLTPTATSVDQVRDIIDESARHNIGDITRNINTPMLTLHFLQADIQDRFRFKRLQRGHPELGVASAMPDHDPAIFRITTEMWVVKFKETRKPTIIKTDTGRDFPAAGRFWIDPETGAVLMSELVMENSEVEAIIDVSYQSEPLLGLLVPVQMRERYRSGRGRVEGVATYGRFRQFQVKTGESIAKPPGGLH